MTNEELRRIDARIAEFNRDATLPLAVGIRVNEDGNYTLNETGGGWIADVFTREIAAFFASAPADVPALVAEVRRLQELEHLLERKTGAFTGAMLIAHQELDQLRADLAAATQRAEVAQRLLESLTPGGSEFYDSPNNCAEWATRRMNEVAKIAKERNELRARAEAAEAALAAVPEAAIMRTLFTGYRSGEQYTADADAINAWAAQRSEAQPRGAPTAVFDASDFEVDESEAQP